MKRFRLLMILLTALLLCAVVPAGDSPWPRPLIPGCWVKYRMMLPAEGAAPTTAVCLIRVLKVRDDALDLEVTVDGISSRRTVTLNGFDPGAALGFHSMPGRGPATESMGEFTIQQSGLKLPAQFLNWSGEKESDRLELIRLPEVPFGLGRLSNGGLVLEVVDFSWGEKPPVLDSAPVPQTDKKETEPKKKAEQ